MFALCLLHPFFNFVMFIFDIIFINDLNHCLNGIGVLIILIVLSGCMILAMIFIIIFDCGPMSVGVLLASFLIRTFHLIFMWDGVKLKDDHQDCNMKIYDNWIIRLNIEFIITLILYGLTILIICGNTIHKYKLPNYIKNHQKYRYNPNYNQMT